MFDRILIANRGEIAVRIIGTARRLGISTAIVYSEADADSLAVEMADEAIAIGPSPAAQSYLVIEKIIAAARAAGADAIHPGFGFLSENAAFARALAAENIVFIGPNAAAIEAMGDKIESKKRAAAAGVSTVPGFPGEIDTVARALEISEQIGFPVMIKASAGGGGKGIRVAENRAEVEEGFPAVRAEAKNAFGDDRVFIEKFIRDPRHIEIQVLGDKHGTVVYLGERECSIQRRNQKVIEEAPSPLLEAKTRAAMGEQAAALARSVNYDSAGTVEFVASGVDRSFYFLEMNTRLQVEHPVTEMITGLDLVEQMIRSAAGEKLSFAQKDVTINGWAVESRLYAEDPRRNFLPSIGRLKRYEPPHEGPLGPGIVRLDSGVREGDEISIFYDPMIAKLVTHAPTRREAIATQAMALDRFAIEGIRDNGAFLATIMREPGFLSGEFTTGYIKATFPDGFQGAPLGPRAAEQAIAACAFARSLLARRLAGISAGSKAVFDWAVLAAGMPSMVRVHLAPGRGHAAITFDQAGKEQAFESAWRPGRLLMEATLDGEEFALTLKPLPTGWAVAIAGSSLNVIIATPNEAALRARLPLKAAPDLSRIVLSPMPGLVVSVDAAPGQEVKAGEGLMVVEAMKMQNIIRAERDGVVAKVHVAAGATVAADDPLVELA